VALAVITKTVGSTPRKAGSKMLIYPDRSISGTIGGGAMEEEVIATAVQCLNDRQIRNVSFVLREQKKQNQPFDINNHPDMICGGNMEVYIEPIFPDPIVYLIGAGHISQALAQFAKLVGFKVVVIDSEKKYANRSRFPKSVAAQIIVAGFKKAIAQIRFDESAYIVILTRSHITDKDSLAACLQKNQPVAYLGMIGSKRKIALIFAELKKSGIPKKLLDAVYAPIGLDIGAETPEEIAVSIVAELIAVSHRK
ncbi:MAG: XdhC/CoxI family protein, partial [bacterium]|nr:XdhC/CoxI family protein [bacterium]